MCNFFAFIQVMKVYPNEKDRLVWDLSMEGSFSVKSLYGAFGGRVEVFSGKLIWKLSLPTKVS